MGHTSPDPRQQILDDITELITEWRSCNFQPIVMMDANTDLSETHLREFVEENDLFDLFDGTNEGTPPKTYVRGQKRLDYIFGSEILLNAVT